MGESWEMRKRHVQKSRLEDANSLQNWTFETVNENKVYEISGNSVGSKVVAPPSQLLLPHPSSVTSNRARFAKHHFQISTYCDGDL